jgi:hypothetical protein
MQETSFGFDESSGEFMDLLSVSAVQDRIRLDSQSINESLGGRAVVHRQCNHLGVQLAEQRNDVIEVNQLLTAVRSPVAPVEQHNTPGSLHQIRHAEVSVVETFRRDLWELIA